MVIQETKQGTIAPISNSQIVAALRLKDTKGMSHRFATLLVPLQIEAWHYEHS